MRNRAYRHIKDGTAPIPPDMQEVVAWVRAHYTFTGDSYDWVPSFEARARSPQKHMPHIRFGVAVSLAFAELDPLGVGAEPVRRRAGRKNGIVRGWSGIKGPGSLRSPEYR